MPKPSHSSCRDWRRRLAGGSVVRCPSICDLGDKRDLYARAGVIEYWVLDLNSRVLVIHRSPHDRFYAHVDILSESGVAAIGDLTIPVSEMFA